MRRPLKPFVTEYKGSRRASPSFSEAANLEGERPVPKLAEARQKPDPDESSYEAAMRAADALFAAPAERKIAVANAPNEQRDDGGADRPWQERPADERSSLERNGGRILRVVDEAPLPQLAALEAEFAPKRRGRKPGSKNKPKPFAAKPAAVLETQVAEAPSPATPAVSPSVRQVAATEAIAPVQRQVVALPAAPASPPRGGDKRYPWVRDRLKPGEDWKRRRLPRVCW